ncbi:hypothetical protein [Rhodosalinus sp.]
MQTMDTLRHGGRSIGALLALNWDWIAYPAAILIGLGLGAFLALV